LLEDILHLMFVYIAQKDILIWNFN
jgi:hypothetical protein